MRRDIYIGSMWRNKKTENIHKYIDSYIGKEAEMDSNKTVKQSSPTNILWKLFRIGVEETVVPTVVSTKNRKFVADIKNNCAKDKTEKA